MSFGAVAAIGGAVIGASASGDAADSQANSAAAATAAQQQALDKQIALQEPFRNAGLKANNRLMELLGLGGGAQGNQADSIYQSMLAKADADHIAQYGIGMDASNQTKAVEAWKSEIRRQADALAAQQATTPQNAQSGDFGSLMRDFSMADFEKDPGYQFRMDEGTKAVEGGAAARGGLLSGAAQKALQKYGQESASQEYGNAFNRFTGQQTNQYNRLAGIVNTGQGATNQVSNAAGQFGQQQANNIIGAGNAQAAGQVGQANALVGGINQAFNGYQNNQLMNMIRNPSAGGTSWGNVNNQYFTGTGGMGD